MWFAGYQQYLETVTDAINDNGSTIVSQCNFLWTGGDFNFNDRGTGMAQREGNCFIDADAKIVFDMDDPMGDSTCVACGECVQACPTGALTETKRLDAMGIDKRQPLREVESVCPYCGVGCQITYQIEGNEVVSVKGADSNCCVRSTCARITVWPRAYAKASDAIQGDHGTIGSVSHQSGQRRVRC